MPPQRGSGAGASGQDALVQLRIAIDPHMQRLKNLFQEWDANGDGKVSTREFEKAMKVLALDVPKQALDALFSTIDKDKSGFIEYKELDKAIQSVGTPDELKKPENAEAEVQTQLTGEALLSDIRALAERAERAEDEVATAWAACKAAEDAAELRARRAAEEVVECKLSSMHATEEAESTCTRESSRAATLASELERMRGAMQAMEAQLVMAQQTAHAANQMVEAARHKQAEAERRSVEAVRYAQEAERREGHARLAEEEACRRADEFERRAADATKLITLKSTESAETLAQAEFAHAKELEGTYAIAAAPAAQKLECLSLSLLPCASLSLAVCLSCPDRGLDTHPTPRRSKS